MGLEEGERPLIDGALEVQSADALVEGDAEGVEVHAIERGDHGLLGRHVSGVSADLLVSVLLVPEVTRDAKVDDLDHDEASIVVRVTKIFSG